MRTTILMCLALCGVAHANDVEKAKALKAQADQKVLARDYPAALALLDAAHEADPIPRYIANRAVVLQRMGRFADAVADFEKFLATNPPPPQARMARQMLQDLRPEAEILSDPPGATVRDAQGEVIGQTPLEHRLVVGRHELTLVKKGFAPLTLTVNMRQGRRTSMQRTLIPREGDPELTEVLVTRKQTPKSKGRLWTWVALGTGAAALAGAGVMYGLGSGAIDDRDSAGTSADWDAAQSDAETFNTGMLIAGGIGIAALIGGGVLFFTEGQSSTAVHVGPGGLGLTGSF